MRRSGAYIVVSSESRSLRSRDFPLWGKSAIRVSEIVGLSCMVHKTFPCMNTRGGQGRPSRPCRLFHSPRWPFTHLVCLPLRQALTWPRCFSCRPSRSSVCSCGIDGPMDAISFLMWCYWDLLNLSQNYPYHFKRPVKESSEIWKKFEEKPIY